MGNLVSKLRKPRKIVVLGLQNSGKSTIIQLLKHKYMSAKKFPLSPTKGLLVSAINIQNKAYVLWEVGGYREIQPFYHCYCIGMSGLIYVMDGKDKLVYEESISLLKDIISNTKSENFVVLVLIHKISQEKEYENIKLELTEILKNKVHNIFYTNVELEDSVVNAFEWMVDKIK
ncbi:small GTP-binding domain protein [Tubulinosema ratisbonensis]|uniref:Small GTP-binding domain protein n=1 Tax=Tubulinosema ratisbonensis TaxID=291195 RepID=A0A437ALQ8_9MICR|nr:small GTP-binding domain protein [Tubulinosema ratisbonensis]